MDPAMDDLLAPLGAVPPADALPVGMVRGPSTEGLAAGLEVWCGYPHGWRRVGDLLGDTRTVILHRGRLIASFTFDLGPATIPGKEWRTNA